MGIHPYSLRFTYSDDTKWQAFIDRVRETTLSTIQHIASTVQEHQNLTISFTLTTIEDKKKLEGATLYQISKRFEVFAIDKGAVYERGSMQARRPTIGICIYVTEESIESVLDRARAAEITGYFFILVNFRSSLYVDANDDNPQHLRPKDVEDMSFKMIAANEVAMNYL